MVLLSRIISHDISKREVVAQFDVEESCIFYDDEMAGKKRKLKKVIKCKLKVPKKDKEKDETKTAKQIYDNF